MSSVDSALYSSLMSALDMSGGLFQKHPSHPDWRTTRPGAIPGEIACFVRDGEHGKDWISVVFHSAGEEDEDGYTWKSDCYEIELSESSGFTERTVEQTREEAVRRLVKLM